MPSPVGHIMGGLIVGLAASKEQIDRRVLVICAIAACLPDIDFGWGRHSMETHSIGFAAIAGVAAYAWQKTPRLAVAVAVSVLSHVLFDWLGSDDFPPLGVMALWPFSDEFYFADAYVFGTISRRYWLPGFVMHNVLAIVREIVILLPVVAATYYLRNSTNVTNPHGHNAPDLNRSVVPTKEKSKG